MPTLLLLLAAGQLGASVDPPAKEGALGPNLAADGEAAVLTWLEPGEVRLSRFARGRWSAPVTVVKSEQLFANWADFPSATVSGGETLVHFLEKSGDQKYAYDVELARGRGARFRRIGEAHDDGTPTEHGFASILPQRDGFRLFWLDGREMAGGTEHDHGPMTLRTALLSKKGIVGSEVLDPRVCECCSTDAAVTRQGPFVVYRDRSEEEIRNITVVRWTPKGWSAPVPIHDDAWKVTGCPVNGPAAAAAGDRAVVAWYTGAELGRVRLSFSSDGAASFGKPIEVHDDPDAAPLGRADVVLTADGAVVAWMIADDEQRARILLRHVSFDGTLGRPLTLTQTSPSRGSGFPRMVRQKDGLLIAFTEIGPPSRVRVRRVPFTALRGAPPAGQSAAKRSDAAPAYRARTLDGAEVSLSDLRGKIVLLNLWATWCGPCRKEMPQLAELHRKHRDRGLVVVGVSVDEPGADERVRALVERLALPYPIWRDPEDRASALFRASALPMSVILDREGKVSFIGPDPFPEIARLFE